MRIGAHTSIAGGLEQALYRGVALGAETVAIFSKNQRQWRVPPLTDAAVAAWHEGLATTGYALESILCHDSYLINLGHPDATSWARSVAAFGAEVDRCDRLGIRLLVFHPGAHLGGLSESACCDRVAEALRRTLAERPDSRVRLLVENTAGQGSGVGYRVAHLAQILDRTGAPDRVGTCFDTCHAFAAGYDLSTAEGTRETLARWDRAVGLDRVLALHLNDALRPLGSRVDRHANIGFGHIGADAFRVLLRDPRLAGRPAVVETPTATHGGHGADIARLRALRLPEDPDRAPAPRTRARRVAGHDKAVEDRYPAKVKPSAIGSAPTAARSARRSPPRRRPTGGSRMNAATLKPALLELIRRASSDLPPDVEQALHAARRREAAGSAARGAVENILENVALARARSTPICQDTGTNLYWVHAPVDVPEAPLTRAIVTATRAATRRGWLRPNAVHPITGQNTGDNVGIHSPQIHFHQHRKKHVEIALMLKGGGCENVSTQYTLPDNRLLAGRDLAGVETCIVHAAHQAQGKGCAPGILGVGVGGDRLSSTLVAKEQLLRPLGDANPDPTLAKLERRCLRRINGLGIGPMGFGGKTTALAVKVGVAHRLPASFFVTIAYMCWADRRWRLVLQPKGDFRILDMEGNAAPPPPGQDA